jgi:uncharacterized protein YraI
MNILRNSAVAAFATTACLLAPSLAQASQGVIVANTALHAGPDDQFPPVDEVQAGTNVDVKGCLTGFTWCDISFQQDRGWVTGQDLEILLQSRHVRVTEATPDVVPFVTFEFDSYWQQNYPERPFYRDRDRYASITINITGGKGPVRGGNVNGDASGGKSANGCPPDKKDCVGQNKGSDTAVKGAGAPADQTKKVVDTGGCKPGDKNCPKGMGAAAEPTKKVGAATADTKGCKPGEKSCPNGVGAAAEPAKKAGAAMADTKGCKPGDKSCPKVGNGG